MPTTSPQPARPRMSLETLHATLDKVLGSSAGGAATACGELTLRITSEHWADIARILRDHPALRFTLCVDCCGIDYSDWKSEEHPLSSNYRFAVVYHLLSLEYNVRLRVRVFCTDDDYPRMPSLVDVWASLNWFEREAFDLYGILFEGHPDLRRILTDYGFVGHPFRKDFPLSGHVEMRYDEAQGKVVYRPVSIEPRLQTPRTVREANYGAGA